ncbi:hypothetical protein [Alkalihalobacillus sp. R86527]|uniref:hypothetical protein n=1 Tax=Alkalihalobacillus sp. R86527 TaxID=3093863 RepID=UPI00366DEC36
MQKNARGYVQETCKELKEAERNLQHALETVEKDPNRQRIQESLNQLMAVQTYCNETEGMLENH